MSKSHQQIDARRDANNVSSIRSKFESNSSSTSSSSSLVSSPAASSMSPPSSSKYRSSAGVAVGSAAAAAARSSGVTTSSMDSIVKSASEGALSFENNQEEEEKQPSGGYLAKAKKRVLQMRKKDNDCNDDDGLDFLRSSSENSASNSSMPVRPAPSVARQSSSPVQSPKTKQPRRLAKMEITPVCPVERARAEKNNKIFKDFMAKASKADDMMFDLLA
eukprot:TRINITY_DN1680_c0_g1_i1.p1 TRINITY_DN1680_c0_g1~~TRINITY_DN1680_c0_g1_i1.p1  ORF type:complete len:219 (-),score=55.57 TRINITY_DN1680_c0_g1_i1:55-711(-)